MNHIIFNFRNAFLFDLLSVIPFRLFFEDDFDDNTNQKLQLLHLFKLFRLYKVS